MRPPTAERIEQTLGSEREQTRALYPDRSGYVEREGVRVFWERYGDGEPTLLFLPTWSIIPSRCWKAQIPYFARHCRVLTFDPRGNGRSDRPSDPAAYDETEYAADAIAVMDATDTERAIIVGLSMGAQRGLLLAAEHPARIAAACFPAPAVPLGQALPARAVHIKRFDEQRDDEEGWAKYNRHYWERDYRGFLEFFFGEVFVEPHSTKQIEDAVGCGLETTVASLTASARAQGIKGIAPELCARVRCPVLVIQGTEDRLVSVEGATELARQTGGELVLLEESGHSPHARDPVRFNLELRDFALGTRRPPVRTWRRGRARRRAFFISSPIGLGHAARRGDRASAARARARPRDRLAGPRPRCPGACGRAGAHPPGERSPDQRVRPHRVRVGRARPALLPGLAAHRRDPRLQLHGVPRPGGGRAVRPVDRPRSMRARLLPP